MNTKVVNKHTHRSTQNDVYIGRGSKWGNPYVIGRDGDRKEVIRKYRQYIVNNDKLLSSVHELSGKTLVCFCKPQACHGDILCELVEAWESI